MADVPSLAVARFMRLVRRSADVWQGGLVRLPTWLDQADGRPRRPWGAVWVSRDTGTVNVQLGAEADWRLALDSLIELGLKFAHCRPARLEVADAELGRRLVEALGDRELAVTVVARLPDVTAMVDRMAAELRGAPALPGALAGRGVTVARLRSFAEAARDFYLAAPWRHLSDEDLVRVEAPAMPRAMRFLCVMGGAGLSFGVAFFPSVRDFESLEADPDAEAVLARGRRWSVLYDVPSRTPIADLDLWEAEGLPLAGERAYPAVLGFEADGGAWRPDAAQLARIEAVLRALARTTEAEIDGARWSHEVPTADGPVRVTLAIPALLSLPPVRLHRTRRAAAREEAEEWAAHAMEARGRARVVLARRALACWRDCADAYGVLAGASADLEQACDFYHQGMAAAERALGPGGLGEAAGPMWLDVRTRPYLRLRLGLAGALAGLGRSAEAVAHYEALLKLDPDDHQGVRYLSLAALLGAGRDAEAGVLLARYPDDADAVWVYGHALWLYRREGDSPGARRKLEEARRRNRRVPAYLTDKREWEGRLPDTYAAGSEEEAAICAEELGEAWRATPGALDWLRRRGT
jgi:tetratricopeptide (TPR) repeat protein